MFKNPWVKVGLFFCGLLFWTALALAARLELLSVPERDLLFQAFYDNGTLSVEARDFSSLELANVTLTSDVLDCSNAVCTGPLAADDLALSFVKETNTLRIHALSGSETQILSVSLEGQPSISFSPSSLDFGSLPVGSTSCQNVTLANSGTGVFFPDFGQSHFPQSPPFNLLSGTCTDIGTSGLAAGSSCTFQVCFAPSQPGNYNDQLLLRGTGVEAELILTGTATSSLQCPCDLELQISQAPSGGVENGLPFQVGVTIWNKSQIPAPSFTIDFALLYYNQRIPLDQVGQVEGDRQFSGVPSNDYVNRTYTVTLNNLALHETYYLEISLNLQDNNSNNNVAYIPIFVYRYPGLDN